MAKPVDARTHEQASVCHRQHAESAHLTVDKSAFEMAATKRSGTIIHLAVSVRLLACVCLTRVQLRVSDRQAFREPGLRLQKFNLRCESDENSTLLMLNESKSYHRVAHVR